MAKPERNCISSEPQGMGPGAGAVKLRWRIARSGRKSCCPNRLCTNLF